ncbi:MAG: hydantoinase/oxoprolinase family protein, partial [Pseudomonadota bacterium]
ETAFAEDAAFEGDAAALARHHLLRAGLGAHRGLIALDAALNVDVIGLGASAPTYYPAVGDHLRCSMVLPEHAGVANAIGAVVGRVTLRRSGQVTSPAEGRFRAHLESGPEDFTKAEDALIRVETALAEALRLSAAQAGADDIQIRATRDITAARVEEREVFVEANVTVEASGRPRIAVEG